MTIGTRIYLGGKPAARLKSDSFAVPIEMFSIALDNDVEIAAFRLKAPDVEISSEWANPLYGVPVARNRHQKLQALKAAEYQERN